MIHETSFIGWQTEQKSLNGKHQGIINDEKPHNFAITQFEFALDGQLDIVYFLVHSKTCF